MVRWNGKEQALHVLLDLAKIFKSAKVVTKKVLQLVFHNSIFKNSFENSFVVIDSINPRKPGA